MKKYLFALLFCVLYSSAMPQSKQFYFGPVGGMNLSLLSEKAYGTKEKVGFLIGGQGKYFINPEWVASAEVYLYRSIFENDGNDMDLKMQYIGLPITISRHMSDSFYAQAGLDLSFFAGSAYEVDGEEVDVENAFSSTVASYTAGFNYISPNYVTIGIRYATSFTEISEYFDTKLSRFELAFGLLF